MTDIDANQTSLRASLQTSLAAAGLGAGAAQALAQLALPAIAIQSTPQANASATALGTSRLGGAPDLPAGATWPEYQGMPLSFIAQVRLEEVAPYDVGHLLPPAGMVWFFYDAQQQTFGDDPRSRGAWQVTYAPTSAGLQPAAFPAALPTQARFSPCALTFSTVLSLPQDPSAEQPPVALSGPDQKAYETFLASYPVPTPHGAPQDQLLGYPTTLQDDMRMECQLAAHGLPVDGSAPATASLASGAPNWQLLFQVDSDTRAGMRWADAGMLYYWIERDALRARSFGNTWVVLQSD